ncbi:hypothetical protein [Peijinzhouia sedimentorum]
MAKLLLSLLFSCVIVFSANAQWQVGFHFSPTYSMGDFKHESNSVDFYGFNFEGAYRLKDSPILVGAAFNYSLYGSQLDKSSYVDNSGQTMRVRTNNNLISNRLFIRLQPDLPIFVQPYVEAAGGYNFFYTRETIRTRMFEEVLDAATLHNSGAFIYGIGGGLAFPIPETIVSIDLRANYFTGQKTDYLTKYDTNWNPDTEILEINPRSSTTDMLMFQVGVNIEID